MPARCSLDFDLSFGHCRRRLVLLDDVFDSLQHSSMEFCKTEIIELPPDLFA